MGKDYDIGGSIYFRNDFLIKEVGKKISEWFNCKLEVMDDEDFAGTTLEGSLFASTLILFQYRNKEGKGHNYNLAMTISESVNALDDALPETINLDDYLYTVLRLNGVTDFLENQYRGQAPIKGDNYELHVSYDFKNSKTLNELKPIIDKLLYCDMLETTKENLPALHAQMLGTDFYIIQQGDENGLFNYHITAEYAGVKEREFKQIDITPFFHSLFKYNKLTE